MKLTRVMLAAAVTICVVVGASAQTVEMSALPVKTVCRNALGQSGWDRNPIFSEYVAEATRRRLTVKACRQMLDPANIATSAAATPASSPQPPEQSTPAEGSSGGWIILLALLVGVVGLVIYRSNKNYEDAQIDEGVKRAKRAIREAHDLAISKVINTIKTEFPFMFSSDNGMSILCMDRQGERLRFVDFCSDSSVMQDLTVPVSSIISVELSGGDEVVTDYETTSSKPDALSGAIVGGLLFGQLGAIVGATAAGSEETTVANNA
jgi:hypothetical protein